MATDSSLEGPWICSVCGSGHIVRESIQPSLGDPAHPLALCGNCHPPTFIPDAKTDPEGHRAAVNRAAQKPPRSRLSPLVRPEEWASLGKGKGPANAREVLPADMWADQLPVNMNRGRR